MLSSTDQNPVNLFFLYLSFTVGRSTYPYSYKPLTPSLLHPYSRFMRITFTILFISILHLVYIQHASSRHTFHIVRSSLSLSLPSFKADHAIRKRTPWRHVKSTSHAAEPHIRSQRDNKDIHTCAADLQPLLLDVSSGRPAAAARSSSALVVQPSAPLSLVSTGVQALCCSSFLLLEVSRSVVLGIVRLSMRATRTQWGLLQWGRYRPPTQLGYRSTLAHYPASPHRETQIRFLSFDGGNRTRHQGVRTRDAGTRITLREKKQPVSPLENILAYPMLANMAGRSAQERTRPRLRPHGHYDTGKWSVGEYRPDVTSP